MYLKISWSLYVWKTAIFWNLCMNQISLFYYIYRVCTWWHRAQGPLGPSWWMKSSMTHALEKNKYCVKWLEYYSVSFCILAACSCIHVYIDSVICDTVYHLYWQVETLQYYRFKYHFSDGTCRDTKFFAGHTIFRPCPSRKYLQNPAPRWLQEMAPLWTRLVRKNADGTQKCCNFA